MTNTPDFLREEYNIDTPENVIFGYDVAGIGSRFIGALIDTTILGVALVTIAVILSTVLSILAPQTAELDELVSASDWVTGVILAVYTLLNFAIIWGYYIAFELLWNGQTPGKRAAGIRVIQMDGSPVTPLAIVVRNLVRIIDFLPSGYALGLIVMFFNQQARRLGDFAAGTLVVRERDDVELDSLTELHTAIEDPYDSEALLRAFPTVERLTFEEYRLIREVLERHSKQSADEALVRRLALAIADKLDYTASEYRPSHRFLQDVAAAYRAAKVQQENERQFADRQPASENSEERTWKNS